MLRIRIAKLCEQESNRRDGLFELDECYLEHEEYEANEEEELRTKTILFGIYERTWKYVYIRIVKNVKQNTLMKIIKSKIELSSTIYTDEFRVYDSLIKEGFHKTSVLSMVVASLHKETFMPMGLEISGLSLKHD